MDEPAREVLTKLKQEIKRNLNLDDDILDSLEAGGILNSDQVQKVKAERTNSEKISLLLYKLQRRGPDAFEAFLDAIRPAYKFLADTLMERYEETRKLDRDSGNSSEGSLEQTENSKPDVQTVPQESSALPSNNLPSLLHQNQPSIQTVERNNAYETINSKLPPTGHPMRKQSGHSLEFMVHPTNHFLHESNNSRRSSHSIDFATHQSLNAMYTKLKMHLFHMNEREQSFSSSPVPITFEMVEGLLDKLLKLEKDCNRAIGATNKESLLTNIINLKLSKADLQKNLNKKEEQVQKYADKIFKFETKCKDNEKTLNQQQNTIESLRLETQHLQEENEKLRRSLWQNAETEQNEGDVALKERNLQEMSKQNEELRRKNSKYEKKLEIMHQKLSEQVYENTNNLNASARDDDVETVPEIRKKKGIAAKALFADERGPTRSTASILQECREVCTETSPRYNMQHMKNKILFAKAKRSESRNHKAFDNQESSEGAMSEQMSNDFKGKRKQYYGTANPYETMAKLTANKTSGATLGNTVKQKSPPLVKTQMPSKGLKKNPRWVRKPLR